MQTRYSKARTSTSSAGAGLLAALTALTSTGCLERELRPLVPCVTQGFVESVAGPVVDKVDLLFMVDNSGSMLEEQASLAEELPRLVRVLTSGDRTGDGPSSDDFDPVKSLHVGVITSDMGVAGFNVPTCTRAPMFGDDGLMPMFLEYEPGVSPQTPDEFGAEFRRLATTGIGGCGFEQQLEATLKAITPSSSGITFFGATRGHGDVENAGFLRPDSVLALVLVTDEEDCSIRTGSEDIFNQMSSTYTGDLNLRCFRYKEAQWPVQRYIDGFAALRPGQEDLLVVGAITGVPVDLIAAGTPDYARILEDPRMVEVEDPGGGGRLVPSCNVPGRGLAFPPRRIVELARGFGKNGIVQSICQTNLNGALDAILGKLIDALNNVCLPRKLNADASGLVDCDVIQQIAPPGSYEGQPTACGELGGVNPVPRRTNADGSLDCEVFQVTVVGGVPSGEGWYYDDFSPATISACGADGRRVAFTGGARPPNGVNVELECLQRIQASGGGTGTAIQLGTFCDPESADPNANPCAGIALACESSTRTCQIPCATPADCPSSLDCDQSSGVGFCRNPICVD